MAFLKGKKTYIVAGLIGVVVVLHLSKIVDDTTTQALLGLLGAGGLITLRSAIN